MKIISKQKLAAQSWVGGAAAAIARAAAVEDGCDRLICVAKTKPP